MSEDGGAGSELAIQIANLLKNNQQPSQPPKLSDNLQINLKLNNHNYPLWTRMIRVAIGGKSKTLLAHLTKEPPESIHESFETWEQEDLIVFSWLIQNIEPEIAGNLTEYPTAKTLWDVLATTYSSGKDKLQIFNLHVKANELKQDEKTLEEFWIALQGVWGEIDRIDPNPMTCADDIKVYAKVRSEQKLFQFLHGLDRRFDPIKREILRLDTLPTAETAYATVRKEAAHQNILGTTTTESHGIATGLAASSGEKDGVGLSGRGYRRYDGKKPFTKEDKSHLTCEECGMSRHTKEQCFRIVGYPDWWTDDHKKGGKNPKSEKKTSAANQPNTSKGPGGLAAAAAATGGPEGSGGSSFSVAGTTQTYGDRSSDSWIFDCGATDTMTYDVSDFVKMTCPMKTHIETANGGKMGVKNGGTIKFNQDIKLHNCLYVPSLSHKLLSISHVTKELNCSALMHPTFCLLQDIKTGRIIGRGTEKHGLYYVDEVTQSGTVMLAHGTMERKAWLWHRRLGHPSGIWS